MKADRFARPNCSRPIFRATRMRKSSFARSDFSRLVRRLLLWSVNSECSQSVFIKYSTIYIFPYEFCEVRIFPLFLALINRAGGLYGRIGLTEVVSTDRTQSGLYTRSRSRFSHADRLSSVNKMFIIWQTRTIWFVWYNWFVLTDMWHANSDELNLILPKFARPLYFLFSSGFLALQFATFSPQLFYRSRCRSRWENPDHFQYRFQPIKFVNSVVPSPCKTQPYNN